jgi:hypothetical protein
MLLLRRRLSGEIGVVLLSVLIQLPLAVYLGHYYDQRSFLDTGYLVSAGLNPYQPNQITVFSNPNLTGTNPIIGYPPPWPLLLGVIYRLTYNITPNLFLYNFATKIPVIIANVALAYATKAVMQNLKMHPNKVRFAWLFLLFNPFTLLTTTAWGEYDTLIALLCLASIYLLSKGIQKRGTLLLSLSVVLKPISLPLIGLPLASPNRSLKKIAINFSIITAVIVSLWFLPLYLLDWVIHIAPNLATSYFKMAGGMTLFNIVELFQPTATLPAGFEFLGYLWIIALLVGYFFIYRHPPKTTEGMVEAAVGLLLIFFLTRSWLSEPNLNLLFPLMLILLGFGKISKKTMHLLWIIPFGFLFLNYAAPQLFFLVDPTVTSQIAAFNLQWGTWRVLARFGLTFLWFAFAIKIESDLLTGKASAPLGGSKADS